MKKDTNVHERVRCYRFHVAGSINRQVYGRLRRRHSRQAHFGAGQTCCRTRTLYLHTILVSLNETSADHIW